MLGHGTCAVTIYSDIVVTATFAQLPLLARPATRITKATIKKKDGRATFRFGAVGTTTAFQCRLVRPKPKGRKRPRAAFSACASPKTYLHLKPGRYTFEVRALNSAGPDSTPVARSFRIEAG